MRTNAYTKPNLLHSARIFRQKWPNDYCDIGVIVMGWFSVICSTLVAFLSVSLFDLWLGFFVFVFACYGNCLSSDVDGCGWWYCTRVTRPLRFQPHKKNQPYPKLSICLCCTIIVYDFLSTGYLSFRWSVRPCVQLFDNNIGVCLSLFLFSLWVHCILLL